MANCVECKYGPYCTNGIILLKAILWNAECRDVCNGNGGTFSSVSPQRVTVSFKSIRSDISPIENNGDMS